MSTLRIRSWTFVCLLLAVGVDRPADSQDVAGPIVGTVQATKANILFRPGAAEAELRMSVIDGDQVVQRITAMATHENDFVAKFSVGGLQPATRYTYQIEEADGQVVVAADERHSFQTVNLARNDNRVSVSFASCVDIEPNAIWSEMENLQVDAAFLMGDTPYIDSRDLNVVRDRHRRLLQVAGLAKLGSHTPVIGTWDDHDFGLNNGNGRSMARGKRDTRRGFVEYRAHNQFGNGTQGVYHKVDLGMLEVFLLDPRYFSQTEPSPVDPKQPTCFGTDQWKWLLKSLRESEAPFKVLAMGAIWQDKKNSETDDMFTYWYERDALLDFIKAQKISGVVLLGGDIHVARHLIHPRRVGYDLHDFVISPGHTRVITSLDVFHPSLEWSLVEGWQFLTLTADGEGDEPKLIAEFRQPDGVVNRTVSIPLSAMVPITPGPDREPRASWSFDKDFTNKSPLGNRVEAQPHNGASIVENGVSGHAAVFDGSKQQYLVVPRSFLDDNSDAHTISLWFKPTKLPSHGTEQRSFLIESTAEGKPSKDSAWHFSVGLRAGPNPNKVNLQLYTHTLRQPGKPESAPVAISQGPFDALIDRESLLDQWNHVAITFDSGSLSLFVDGDLIAKHSLPVSGPASEFGGLIIGGHRAGAGRNFTGMIDEVKVWQRLLSQPELAELAE